MIPQQLPKTTVEKDINYPFLLACLGAAAAVTAAIIMSASKSAAVAGTAFAGKTLVAVAAGTTAASSLAFFPVALVLLGVVSLCSLVPFFRGHAGRQPGFALEGGGYNGHGHAYRYEGHRTAQPTFFGGYQGNQHQHGHMSTTHAAPSTSSIPTRFEHAHSSHQVSHAQMGNTHRHGH